MREVEQLRAELAARKRLCSCVYWPETDRVMPSPNCSEHGVEAHDKKILGEHAIEELEALKTALQELAWATATHPSVRHFR